MLCLISSVWKCLFWPPVKRWMMIIMVVQYFCDQRLHFFFAPYNVEGWGLICCFCECWWSGMQKLFTNVPSDFFRLCHIVLLMLSDIHRPAHRVVLHASTHGVWHHLCALHLLRTRENNRGADGVQVGTSWQSCLVVWAPSVKTRCPGILSHPFSGS